MLSDASLIDLAARLVQMEADAIKRVLQSLGNNIYDRHMKGPKLSFPLQYFLDATEPVEPSNEYNGWIDPGWNSWDVDKRMSYVHELFGWGRMGWFGDNLREMRSKMVEDWLALPEPLPNIRYVH